MNPINTPQPQAIHKPFHMGTYVKTRAEQLHIAPVELGKRLGITYGNVYRIFNQKQMSLKMMLKASEVLGENLLEKYHPNVPMKPHPLETEIVKLREENTQLKQQLTALQTAAEENKLLKAQLEVLREVVKSR